MAERANPRPVGGEPQQSYGVNLCFQGVWIALWSHHQFDADTFRSYEELIPGMVASDKDESDSPPQGRVIYLPAEEIDIAYSDAQRTLVIQGPERSFGQGRTLAFVAQYMAECLRAANIGLMLVHSAAVKAPDQDRSYVILGEKGAGKTTLALRLCHEYGFALIGNDQVYIGTKDDQSLVTKGGTAWFDVRETAIAADDYIARLIPRPPSTTKPAWNNKVRVEPENIGVTTWHDESPVAALFHIRIDQTQPETLTSPWGNMTRNLILHEKIGRHITGQATPFLDDEGNYLGSLPPIELKRAVTARNKLVGLIGKMGVTELFAPDGQYAVAYVAQRLGL